MLVLICIFFALGVGTLLYATDIFGYSAQVNEHIKDLKSGRTLNKKEKEELYYFKLINAARIFALFCLLAGTLLLAIYLLGKSI